jgi:tungstate transport system substrate-binding protein
MMRPLVALAIVLVTACGSHQEPPRYLALATTTSVGNSGLLDVLAPAWQRDAAIEIRPTLVGSGRALRMLASGQADVVISHAPDAEAAALREHGTAWRYRKIMYNDFVVVGPGGDPASLRGAATMEDALRRLVRAKVRFVSRGDQSGTHEREQALWRLAGESPSAELVLTSGAGMAVTLRQASDREAYTLTDRATFEQLKASLRLAIVWQGDPRLLNTYAVVVDTMGPRGAAAAAFASWLSEGAGRKAIEAYRIAGSDIRPFTVWPVGAAHEPQSVPSVESPAGL